MFNKINRITWNASLVLQRNIMFYFSLILSFLIAFGAFLRYVFHINMFGVEEVIKFFAFWLYFTGAAYGAFENSHIQADIVSSFVTNLKIRSTIQAFVAGVVFLLSILGIYAAWGMVSFSFQMGSETAIWRFPLWILQGSVLFGFVFMTLYFGAHFGKKLKNMKENLSKKHN